MKTNIIAALVVALGLSACAVGGAQEYAGINHGRVSFTDDGKPKEIVVYGGKEQGRVYLAGKLPDGTEFTYEATDVTAFEGQALRAKVDEELTKQLGESWRETAPGLVDAVVKAITGL